MVAGWRRLHDWHRLRPPRGELVGYDISFAYELARDLNVKPRSDPAPRWNLLDVLMKANGR